MPLYGVKLETTKERAEAVQSTPTSTLTDLPVKAKERLMSNLITPYPHPYRPTQKELGLLRRRLIARGWSRDGAELLVRRAGDGADPEFARYLIQHFVYRKGRS